MLDAWHMDARDVWDASSTREPPVASDSARVVDRRVEAARVLGRLARARLGHVVARRHGGEVRQHEPVPGWHGQQEGRSQSVRQQGGEGWQQGQEEGGGVRRSHRPRIWQKWVFIGSAARHAAESGGAVSKMAMPYLREGRGRQIQIQILV